MGDEPTNDETDFWPVPGQRAPLPPPTNFKVACPVCGREVKPQYPTRTVPAAHKRPDGSKCPRDQLLIPERFARMFGRVLLEWLGKVGMRKVLDLNRAETDSNVCHSHDFCDANEAMAEAFERLGVHDGVSRGIEVYDKAVNEGKTEAEAERIKEAFDASPEGVRLVDLWNDSWTLAKANGFFLTDKDLRLGPTGPGWNEEAKTSG